MREVVRSEGGGGVREVVREVVRSDGDGEEW